MPKPQNPFADIPPITDFESSQRVRGLLLQRLGDLLGVWEGCENRACTRARSCQRKDAACLGAFMQAVPDEERRELRLALEKRSKELGPDAAAGRARVRVTGGIGGFEKWACPIEKGAGNPSPASKSAVADFDTLNADLGQARDQ